MKKIIFNHLRIKNFLSVGDPGINLNFKSGITVITGENKDKDSRNGVGKSSIIESIYWALFGSTLRDIKKDKILHNQAKKECVVDLDFTVYQGDFIKNYTLSRSIEPNKIILKLDGEDISLSSMPKTDAYIKELIGANEEVFQNAVIMSANNTIPFMAQKKVDKRKFIEGVLQLNVFSEMLLKARADYNEYKNENTKLSSQFIEQQKNLEIYEKQIIKNKETKQLKIDTLKGKIKNTEDKILEVSSINLEELELQIKNTKKNIEEKETKLQDIQTNISPKLDEKIKLQQQTLNSILSKIDNLKNTQIQINTEQGVCTLCKRPFDNHPQKDNQKLLEEIEKELKALKKEHQIAKDKIKTLLEKEKEVLNLCNSLKNKISDLKILLEKLIIDSKSLEQLNIRLQELKEELKNLLEETDPLEELLKNVKIEIENTEKALQEIQKQMSILDTVKFVVSEEGVKTFIIKKMLHLLNARLNHYLQILEAPCTCNFDETFEETLVNEKGKESSYFNFSGGERKRIDLAVLFMFQDILRNQTGSTFSISMYDELFDSALDAKGVSKILEILRERAENYEECVYIVSHNKETLKADVDHIVLLQKTNGKTELIS